MRRSAFVTASVRTWIVFSFPAILFSQATAVDQFETKIRPVLASRCYGCHSGVKAQSGLQLDTISGLKKGGNSGPLLDLAAPERSVLLRAISHRDKELKMPPGKPLPPETIADFETWVRAGAPLPELQPSTTKSDVAPKTFWSFQAPGRMSPPPVRNTQWSSHPVDRFVLAKLEEKGLDPSAEAEKRVLIRRVTYDLTGLAPTAAEIEAFLSDTSSGAYERLVDRLLASPRYGERWGRHWLDVARYSDARNPGDRFPWSYTYRDWVIRAINEDLPYDRFLVQQLAADRLVDNDKRNLAALGFISLGREFPKAFPETVDDRIDAVSRGMLGLTVACARCHDHKYDPIPTTDYYALYSVLSNIREPENQPVIGDGTAEPARQRMYEARLERIRKSDVEYRVRRHAEMISFFKTQVAEYLVAAHEATSLSHTAVEELVRDRQLNLYLLNRWREYLSAAKKNNDPIFRAWHTPAIQGPAVDGHPLVAAELRTNPAKNLRELADRYASLLLRYDSETANSNAGEESLRMVLRGKGAPLDVPLSEFDQIYTEGDGNNTRFFRGQFNGMLAMYAYDGGAPRAMTIEDVPNPKPAHVFLRGNANNPGVQTPARFLTCLSNGEPQQFKEGSGRLELARAIASRENPLTARVLVNRVWMHHFGQGLVRTPSDFGLRGDSPTHPELLDHLAVTFMENGWSQKKLHRYILLSATYRQSSADRPEARKVDPENLLLWKMNRRRLDFESLRDSMLAAAGTLDAAVGGPPFSLAALPIVPRRTVYGYLERGKVPGVLSLFDFPSPDQHAPMRFTTTVPQQALFFLNSPFVAEQAKQLVRRADAQDAAMRIQQLYRAVFGREALRDEVAAGIRFLEQTPKAGGDAETKRLDVWQYGTLAADGAFRPFRYFTGDAWQGSSMLPDRLAGSARLRANGGEPGEAPVVRRWVSPLDGRISIEGTLRHNQRTFRSGDGVRARLVSSRLGELASWVVDGRSAETRMTGVEVNKGDTIDFVVDGRDDPTGDDFVWDAAVQAVEPRPQMFKAAADFRGPAPERLSNWEQYAQVLLNTNEFAFVD